jgi:hypothetical protein
MKVSIVSEMKFIDSIVSVHRIYETWEVQRFNFFISASCQAWVGKIIYSVEKNRGICPQNKLLARYKTS